MKVKDDKNLVLELPREILGAIREILEPAPRRKGIIVDIILNYGYRFYYSNKDLPSIVNCIDDLFGIVYRKVVKIREKSLR